MLTFKKNWLYRYNEWSTGNLFTLDHVTNYKSLCSYFWGSVWNLLGAPFLLMFLTIVLSLLGNLILVLPFDLYVFEKGTLSNFFYLIATGISTWALLFLLIWSYIAFIHSKVVQLFNKSGNKEPNLLVEYVKAKKSKICPLIKFED